MRTRQVERASRDPRNDIVHELTSTDSYAVVVTHPLCAEPHALSSLPALLKPDPKACTIRCQVLLDGLGRVLFHWRAGRFATLGWQRRLCGRWRSTPVLPAAPGSLTVRSLGSVTGYQVRHNREGGVP